MADVVTRMVFPPSYMGDPAPYWMKYLKDDQLKIIISKHMDLQVKIMEEQLNIAKASREMASKQLGI